MRKRVEELEKISTHSSDYLDLEQLAMAHISSEDPDYPIEAALVDAGGPGWKASAPGKQSIRLIFDEPLKISRMLLTFEEHAQSRTQEFVLRWSSDNEQFHDVLRQQYHFSPPNTTTEIEDYTLNLTQVKALELCILPDINNAQTYATLKQLRLL